MTMIYAGCLLIYRPYVTIAVLTANFLGFFNILLTYKNGLSFQPKEVVINGADDLALPVYQHILLTGRKCERP